MDLPVTRITGAALTGETVLEFTDTEFKQVLLRLDPTTRSSGYPVLVCRDAQQNVLVYKITSDYELAAVSMRRLIGLLRRRLAALDLWPMYMALAYEAAEGWVIGLEPVEYVQNDEGLYTSRLV